MERDLKLAVSKERIKITIDNGLHYDVKTTKEAVDILMSELSGEDLLEALMALTSIMKRHF